MTDILHNKRFIWILFISLALATLIIYVLTALDAGQGNLLMPLDDVYIHFQYARQMALGHPYQYNLIDPATSGATSLIYPYLLTLGYLIGFKGLWLGLWAMILGTLALIASLWAVYRLCKVMDVPQWLSLLTAISFALTGSIAWHFMSGMETGIVITLTLFTLLFVLEKRLIPFLIVSTLLTISRPEAGLVSAIASATMFLRLWHDFGAQDKSPTQRKYLLLLAFPILAIGLQPLVNLLITGTTVATGAQAKSILATVPQDMTLIIGRIWDNFTRMWLEFVTGYDAQEGRGWYLSILTGLTGLLAIPMLIFKKDYRLVGLMLLGCFLALTGAISTLDNAFWHFKRYQMPMMALLFPLSAWFMTDLMRRFQKMRYPVYILEGIVIPVFAIALFLQFQHYHAMNVSYVYQQPYQMGIWLRDNTPEDSLVAVHDVGLMRYISERSTLDMVGLTTPGAAAYWRNGPGSVAEFLINEQPDYIASYGRGHGYGLAYLADTSLYENQLADFTIPDWQPHLNVALAANSQGIYDPPWTSYLWGWFQPDEAPTFQPPLENSELIAFVDVADINSENQYNYSWRNLQEDHIPFITEVREFNGFCDVTCAILDGGRLITGEESFVLHNVNPDIDIVLQTRLHSAFSGTLDIYVNEEFVDEQIIVARPGKFEIINTLISPETLDETITIRITPTLNDGQYIPYSHAIYQGQFIYGNIDFESVAIYQNGAMQLESIGFETAIPDYFQRPSERTLYMGMNWYSNGQAQGDYRFFIHLYDNRDEPPTAQYDNYIARFLAVAPDFEYSLPPGNWLPETISTQIITRIGDIPPSTYQLAIGFYNPNDPTDRLIPESDIYEVTPDGRLWLGEVIIDE